MGTDVSPAAIKKKYPSITQSEAQILADYGHRFPAWNIWPHCAYPEIQMWYALQTGVSPPHTIATRYLDQIPDAIEDLDLRRLQLTWHDRYLITHITSRWRAIPLCGDRVVLIADTSIELEQKMREHWHKTLGKGQDAMSDLPSEISMNESAIQGRLDKLQSNHPNMLIYAEPILGTRVFVARGLRGAQPWILLSSSLARFIEQLDQGAR